MRDVVGEPGCPSYSCITLHRYMYKYIHASWQVSRCLSKPEQTKPVGSRRTSLAFRQARRRHWIIATPTLSFRPDLLCHFCHFSRGLSSTKWAAQSRGWREIIARHARALEGYYGENPRLCPSSDRVILIGRLRSLAGSWHMQVNFLFFSRIVPQVCQIGKRWQHDRNRLH